MQIHEAVIGFLFSFLNEMKRLHKLESKKYCESSIK